jgi:uncharacterized protein (TIGR02594 family)
MSDPAKPSRFRQAAIEARERANAYKEKRESRERKDAYEEKRQTAKAKESTRKGDKPEKNPEVAGGQPVKFFTNAQGQVIPITPASGGDRVIKTGPSLYRDPKDGTPYKIDPLAPSGLRNAWNDAPVTSKNGKLVQKITGVGERTLGEDPKAQAAAKAKEEKAAEKTAKTTAEASAKAEQDEMTRAIKVGRVGVGASKRVVADADTQFASQTKQAREKYNLAKNDLDYDKQQIQRLDKALDEMTDVEQLPVFEAQKKEIEATLAAKEKRAAELDAEAHRAALREEEWRSQGRSAANQAIGAEEDRLKLMTNTGRREAIPQPVEPKPGNEGFRPISDGGAPLLMPGMKLMPNGSTALDALAEADSLMPNLQKVRIDRADQAERDSSLFPIPAALPARDLAGQMARQTAREVGKADLFAPEGFEITKDEVKANGQTVARVHRDDDGIPALEMKRGAPSPSLAAGNPYDGVPEYADVAPEFTAKLKGSGDDKAIADEWRARRWSPEMVSDVITRWQSSNDAERGEILVEMQPGMNEQIAKWMADPSQPMPRLNTRALWQSGQISAQEGRQLERIFYGEAPGPGEPRQAWNAFIKGDSLEAKAIRAEESLGGNLRKYNAAIDAAASKFIAEYHGRNASRIDFDPGKFAAFADTLAKDTKGYYGRIVDTLDSAAQSGVGSSLGAIYSLAIRAPATVVSLIGQAAGGLNVDDAAELGGVSYSWDEIDLIHGQTGESAKGMLNFIRDRATLDVTALWSGVEGKKLTKSLDELTKLAGDEQLTPDQRVRLRADIQKTALALTGTDPDAADYFDIDNPESPAAQALNAYQATRNPVYKDALRHALTSTPRARYLEEAAAAYASANGTLTDTENFGRLQMGFVGAQVAPVQEQAVEALSAGAQAVASKALMGAKTATQKAIASGKALTWANRATLKAEQLGDWFSTVGMVKGSTLRNTAVQGLKTAGVSFVSEGMEGAITSMGTGATVGDVLDGFVQEGLGALGMGPVMATVGMGADAVAKGAAYAKDNAAVRGFVANWNKDNPTDPMTAADWKQARAYLPPTTKATAEEVKTALETIAQSKAVVAQIAKSPASPAALAQVQAATQKAQAAVQVLTAATQKQQAAVKEAKNIMQEVNGIADPALREFANAAVRAVRGMPLTEAEAEALERAVAGVEPGPVAPPPVRVDAKGQPLKDAPVEPMPGIPLAKRQADGTYVITEAGLAALNEAMPRTGAMIFPPDEQSQTVPSPTSAPSSAPSGDADLLNDQERTRYTELLDKRAKGVATPSELQELRPLEARNNREVNDSVNENLTPEPAVGVGQTMSDPQQVAPAETQQPVEPVEPVEPTPSPAKGVGQTMSDPQQAETLSDENIVAEPVRSIYDRTTPGQERDQAIANRRAAAVRIAATLKRGDKVIEDGGEEFTIEGVLPNGKAFVEGYGEPIDIAAILVHQEVKDVNGNKVQIKPASIIRKREKPAETPAPQWFMVPITITSKTGGVRTMNIPVQASTPEQAAEMAMKKPQVRAMLKGGATATVGDIGQPAVNQQPATPTSKAPTPAQPAPEPMEPTAPPETEAEVPEQAARAREQIQPFARMLRELATAFGYKIVDTGLPFGFTDRYGKFHSFGTQIIDKAFPGSEVGQWIDKVQNSGMAEVIEANMSAPWFHRVWFGHDPLASVGAVIDKFGVGVLPEYAGQLLKDSLTKSGIPLPGVQWLVHAGVVSDKAATEWMSLNIGEALSSGLALVGTYRLYKRAKNGQEIATGWAAVGILFKMVGGVLSANPVLILSGIADAVIVVAAKKGTLKAGFQKARELENTTPLNRRDSDGSQPTAEPGAGRTAETATGGDAEAGPATDPAPNAPVPASGGRDQQSRAGGSRPTTQTTGTQRAKPTPANNPEPEITPNEQPDTPEPTPRNNAGSPSQSGQPAPETVPPASGGRVTPPLTRKLWDTAVEAALAQFAGRPNATARAQTALAVLRRSLSARKGAFDDIELVEGLPGSGILTEGMDPGADGRYTRVVLKVDLSSWVAQNLRMEGDVIAQIVSHEVIHAMQLREFSVDEMRDFWGSLPADLQSDAYQSYFAAAIDDGRMEEEPAEWSDEIAVTMGFEAQRMLFEDRLFGQKITEAAQADPGLKQKLVDMFKRLINRLRNLTATDPALKAVIDWHTARAVEALQRLGVQVPGHRNPSSAVGREMKNTGQRIAALREYTRRQDPNVPKWYAITDNGVVLSADANVFKAPWEARRAMAEEARRFGQWLAWDAGIVGSASIPDPLNEFPASIPYMERIWLPADVQEMAESLGWGYDTEPNPDENWFRDDGAVVAFVPPVAPPDQRTPQVRTPLPVATLVEGPVQGPLQDTLIELPARARTLEGMRDAVRARMDELEAMDPDDLTERQQDVYNRALPRFEALLAKIEARLMPSWERTAAQADAMAPPAETPQAQKVKKVKAKAREKAGLPAESPPPAAAPDSSVVFDAIKSAYPFKGTQTAAEERRFLTKVKAALKPLGIAGWKIDSAVDTLKRRRAQSNSGRLYYVEPTGLHAELRANGDIARPSEVAPAPTSPASAPTATAAPTAAAPEPTFSAELRAAFAAQFADLIDLGGFENEVSALQALPDNADMAAIQASAPQSVANAVAVAASQSRPEFMQWLERTLPHLVRFAAKIWKNAATLLVGLATALMPVGSSPASLASIDPATVAATVLQARPATFGTMAPWVTGVELPESKIDTVSQEMPAVMVPAFDGESSLNLNRPEIDVTQISFKGTREFQFRQLSTRLKGPDQYVNAPKSLAKWLLGRGDSAPTTALAALLGEHESNSPKVAAMLRSMGVVQSADTFPWCAASVSFALNRTGSPTRVLSARQFLSVGKPTQNPRFGDVVVMWNNNPATGGKTGWGGHVGLYLDETDTHIAVLNGNVNDEVAVTLFSKERVLGYRRVAAPAAAKKTLALNAPEAVASEVFGRRRLPPAKLAGFVELAAKMDAEGVNTPAMLATFLDTMMPNGAARPFSQALWNAIGVVNQEAVEAAGRVDWEQVYNSPTSTALVSALAADAEREQAAQVNTVLTQEAVRAAASVVNTEPTEAQKKAGNYQKGHLRLHGLDISIENPAGSERSGTDRDGKAWSVTLPHHYGYLKRTTGKDGDNVDVFIGPKPESQTVFVVDQVKQGNGHFDEHKIMLGFETLDEARAGYESSFTPGWKVGPVFETSLDDLKAWLAGGDFTKKASEQFEPVQMVDEAQPIMGETVLDKDWTSLTAEEGPPPLDREFTGYGQWRRQVAQKVLPQGTPIEIEALALELADEISKENGEPGIESWQHHIIAQNVAAQLITGLRKDLLVRTKAKALTNEYAQWFMGGMFEKQPVSVEAYDANAKGAPLPPNYVRKGISIVYQEPLSPVEQAKAKARAKAQTTTSEFDRPLFASSQVQELRHDKTQWSEAGYGVEGAIQIVSRFYKPAAFANIPANALLVPVPSTSGNNVLPHELALRIAQDYGQMVEVRPAGVAGAQMEAKNKRTFLAKENDPVYFTPVTEIIEAIKNTGRPVFVTEDVHNTGESWIAFVRMLQAAGIDVAGVAALTSTEQRLTSDQDIKRVAQKIAAHLDKPIDEVLPAVQNLLGGSFKQLANKAETDVTRSKESAAKIFAVAQSGQRTGAYANPLGQRATSSETSQSPSRSSQDPDRGLSQEPAPAAPPVSLVEKAKAKARAKKVKKPTLLDKLEAYFQPGALVEGYGGTDRVISFRSEGGPLGSWGVTVIRVTKDGQPVPSERERVHQTLPSTKKLDAAWAKKQAEAPVQPEAAPEPAEGEPTAVIAEAKALLPEVKRRLGEGLPYSTLRDAIPKAEQSGDVTYLKTRIENVKARLATKDETNAQSEAERDAKAKKLAAEYPSLESIDREIARLTAERTQYTSSKLGGVQSFGGTVDPAGNLTDQILLLERAKGFIATPPAPVSNVEQAKAKARAKVAGSAAAGGLTDFGEKLGGARKDKVPTINADLTDSDIAGKTLSEIWPKSEIDSLEDTRFAALATTLRDSIPTKPQRGYKLNAWVSKIRLIKGLMQDATTLGLDALFNKMRQTSSVFGPLVDKIRMLERIDRAQWGRVGAVRNYPDAYRFENGAKVPSPWADANVDGRSVTAKNLEELTAAVIAKLSAGKPVAKMEFVVYGTPGNFKLTKKGDPFRRALKTFTDQKPDAAFEYRKTNYADLVAAWEQVKDRDNVKETDLRTAENRPRRAQDYRQGKDVTPEDFQTAFGFRGVEFGNWVSQGKNAKERQGMINEAFDAFHDLAGILKVPTQALSLGGQLGMGFGSRGHGWASAHYEPGTIVINLTKTRGAGTLAHEFFHALDHYFGRARGLSIRDNAGVYITNEPETRYVNTKTGGSMSVKRWNEINEGIPSYFTPEDWKRQEGVRPEVEESFAALVKALDASPMTQRARRNDKGKSDYWGSTIERAARAFENYVIHKMQVDGYQNDYLANVVPVEDFVRDAGRYPYLLENEIQPVAQAFDDVFSTLKTRKDGKKVVLYAPEQIKNSDKDQLSASVSLAESAIQGYLDADNVNIPASKQPAAKRAIRSATAARGKAYPLPTAGGISRGLQERVDALRDEAGRSFRGLTSLDTAAIAGAFAKGKTISALLHDFVSQEIPGFNIRGAILKTSADFAAFNLAVRTPHFESVKIAVLGDGSQVIHSQIVHVGSVNESILSIGRLAGILEAARMANPAMQIEGFLIAHNHPSGETSPSEADRRMTRKMVEMAEMLNVPFIDHVITNGEQFFSFREVGMLNQKSETIPSLPSRTTKLPVLPTPAVPQTGNMANWEAVPSSERPVLNQPYELAGYLNALRTADPDHHHLLFLDTRLQLRAVERIPISTAPAAIATLALLGAAREGSNVVALNIYQPSRPTSAAVTPENRHMARIVKEGLSSAGIELVEAMVAYSPSDYFSFRENGLMEESPAFEKSTVSLAEDAPSIDAEQSDFVKAVKDETVAGRTVGTSNATATKGRTGEGTDGDHNVDLDRLRKHNPLAYRKNALLLTRYPLVGRDEPRLAERMRVIDAPLNSAMEALAEAREALKQAKNEATGLIATAKGWKKAQVKAKHLATFLKKNGQTATALEIKRLDKQITGLTKKVEVEKKNLNAAIDSLLKEESAISLEDAEKIYNTYVAAVESNLKTLIEMFPEGIRDFATLWYDGANIIAQHFGKKYKATLEQASAVLAVFSPQKDWFMNVSLAERMMDVWKNHQNSEWTAEMTEQFIMRAAEPQPVMEKDKETGGKKEKLDKNGEVVYQGGAKRIVESDGSVTWTNWDNTKAQANVNRARAQLDRLQWKSKKDGIRNKLSDLKDPQLQSRFIRMFSETYHDVRYQKVTPHGEFVGNMTNEEGVELKIAWGGYNTIEKAIAVMTRSVKVKGRTLTDEHEVISTSLGDQHKVRSFYNNIVDPRNLSGHVTMDTHAVAALLWLPLSGASLEVTQNFGGGGVKNDGAAGIKGMYAANAKAYRMAAVAFNLLPREVQSITWEAVRLLFPATWKAKKANVANVRAVWDSYLKNELTLDEARAAVFRLITISKDHPEGRDLARAIADGTALGKPAWANGMGDRAFVPGQPRRGYDARGLSSGGRADLGSGRDAGESGAGDRGRDASAVVRPTPARDESRDDGRGRGRGRGRIALGAPEAVRRLDKATIEKLDSEPTVTRYRTMALIDGQLYPPMSTFLEGNLRSAEPMGEWMQSEERPDLVIQSGRNAGKFKLKGPNGDDVYAIYAPYFHSSQNPLNAQFAAAYRKPYVTVEIEIPKKDDYQAPLSKRAVGAHPWGKGRIVDLSRYAKIKRIVPDAEVAQLIRDSLPEGVTIPDNVVTPSLRRELEKVGVGIDKTGIVPNLALGAPEPIKPLTRESVFAHRLATAKAEIVADMANGTIPAGVRSFAGLQNHVDANEYVNDAERPDRQIGPLGKQLGWGTQEYVNFTSELINALDKWLKGGRKGEGVRLGAPERVQPVTPAFYSQLAEVVKTKMPARADAKTLKGIITNPQTGIKAEEVKWSAIMPWIESQGDKIEKQAVLDYLASDGAVRLEEVVSMGVTDFYKSLRVEGDGMGTVIVDGSGNVVGRYSSRETAQKDIDNKRVAAPNVGKYSQYQLPGGHNYREVVLAMPVKTEGSGTTVTFADDEAADSFLTDMDAEGFSEMDYGRSEDNEYAIEFDQPITSQVAELIRQNGGTIIGGQSKDAANAFTSRHFPNVPNYVAHMRVNERTDSQGRPGTFIEEIQSDRHQQGRKKGYSEDAPSAETIISTRIVQMPETAGQYAGQWAFQNDEGRFEGIRRTKEEAIAANEKSLRAVRGVRQIGTVPDAPFRATWPLQMFKRALADAVAKGKLWIGWTTGETQVARFDLSQQLDELQYRTDDEGKTYILAGVKDDNYLNVFPSTDPIPKEKLEEYVGKDVAQQIIDGGSSGSITGDGLKVGGKGMVGFYDTILPKEIGKFVKQWGGRVEQSVIPTEGKAKTTQAARDAIRRNDMLGFDNVNQALTEVLADRNFATTWDVDAPDAAILQAWKDSAAKTGIWRVDITPAMRQSIQQQGLALFAPQPVRPSKPAAQHLDGITAEGKARRVQMAKGAETDNKKRPTHGGFSDVLAKYFYGRFDKLDYFVPGIKRVIQKNQFDEGFAVAAINGMMDKVRREVRAAFGDPGYWSSRKKDMEAFLDQVLPVASRLEVAGVADDGSFIFTDFERPVGFLTVLEAQTLNLAAGDMTTQDIEGVPTVLSVGALARDRGGFVLYEWMPADVQAGIYQGFAQRFPTAVGVLDQYLMPGMENVTEVGPGGTVVPTFNRGSLLATFNTWPDTLRNVFGDAPLPMITTLGGWTPDVAVQRNLAQFMGQLLRTFMSDARTTRSGTKIQRGEVRNLIDGFSVTAMESIREKNRLETRRLLINRASVRLDRLPQVQRADMINVDEILTTILLAHIRRLRLVEELKPTKGEPLTPDQAELLRGLVGDAARFWNKEYGIHRNVHKELMAGMAHERTENSLLRAIEWFVDRFNRGVLVSFGTYVTNWASNEILRNIATLNSLNYAILSAVTGQGQAAKLGAYEFSHLVRGMARDRIARTKTRISEVVPEEIVSDSGGLTLFDIDPKASALFDLGNLDPGSAFLKAIGYGNVDTNPKMAMIYRILRARADLEADKQKLKGRARRDWVLTYLKTAHTDQPKAFQDAYDRAMFWFMDYANVPAWIDPNQSQTQLGRITKKALFPFIKWGYNYLRQLYNVTGGALITATSRGASGEQRRRSMANLMTMGALTVIGAAMSGDEGGDDDDPMIGRNYDDEGRDLAGAVRTGDRINASRVVRLVRDYLRRYGIDIGTDGTLTDDLGRVGDLYMKFTKYPYLREAVLLGMAANGDWREMWEHSADMGQDYMQTGILMNLTPVTYKISPYNRDKSFPVVASDALFDLLTAPLIPSRARDTVTKAMDPIRRRLRPIPGLKYDPGIREAIMSNIPGLSQYLPAEGEYQAVGNAPFKVDEWAKARKQQVKADKELPATEQAAMIAEINRRAALIQAATVPEQVALLEQLGIPRGFLDLQKTTVTNWPQDVTDLQKMGVGTESIRQGTQTRNFATSGTSKQFPRLFYPKPQDVARKPGSLSLLGDLTGLNFMPVPQGAMGEAMEGKGKGAMSEFSRLIKRLPKAP